MASGFADVGEANSVLVKVADARAAGLEAQMRMGFGAGEAETILTVPAAPSGNFGMAGEPMRWLRVDAGGNAWDRAHALAAGGGPGNAFGMASGVAGAEPDIVQQWLPADTGAAMGVDAVDPCAELPQTTAGNRAIGDGFAWHLGPDFGGLAAARAAVGKAAQQRVRIAHVDTGYDPAHTTLPRGLRRDLQRNFVPGDAKPDSAEDQVPIGVNPSTHSRGHGTGTIGILAGGDVGPRQGFAGDLGGAPDAQVVPIRVANFVCIFSTATMVQGLDHAIANQCDVLSMSLGGLASAALADAVNLAYESGLVLVTAAGNTIVGAPSPKSIVYPARMARVLAATGVMADGRGYAGLDLGTMEGCHGPASKMATAAAGWTPNIPWARIGCGSALRLNGEGTSAATPQVAAAAALWIAHHYDELAALPERWMRIEAVRNALFGSARRTTAAMNGDAVLDMLGRGAVRADAALAIGVGNAADFRRTPPASASWDWLKMITGVGLGFDGTPTTSTQAMFGLELQQLAFTDPDCIVALGEADTEAPDGVGAAVRRRFLEAAIASPRASNTMKAALDGTLATGRDAGTAPPPAPEAPPPAIVPDASTDGAPPPPVAVVPPKPQWRAPRQEPMPTLRRLRVFALDPALAADFDTVRLSTTTITVPYEDDLRPGPVGEYLEVVDVDPASDRIYAPVDLNSRQLLAQDGLEPSEGNPQFHQQMVYAIAMKTITAFESALGRRSLWAKFRDRTGDKPRDHFVPRLRLYPHALRAKNAYYSPDKIAVLLGYFNATTARGAEVVDNSMVFSALSADIVAHEVTHALLDGLHRRYQESSNPDVGAFHEAFADIVALFQHFTFEELVASAISKGRSDLSAKGLLSGLAGQFGLATGKDGALRDYLANDIASYDYRTEFEVHRRGAILVLCIWKAFLTIVTRRNQDLIKLATGGSGLLPEGELHPLLVARLARETAKAADQVQRMCIRALDYCPPADITFAEYLRALMTADLDHVPDDRLGYRTAMLQAFRTAGILPAGLRTVSVESLVWREAGDIKPFVTAEAAAADRDWLSEAVAELKIEWGANLDRETIYRGAEDRRWIFRTHLLRAFAEGLAVPELFGLQSGLQLYNADFTPKPPNPRVPTNFEVHNVRRIRRARPDGSIAMHIVVVIAQRRPERLDPNNDQSPQFWFRGGATIIIDPVFTETSVGGRIRYIVSKPMKDANRLAAQRKFLGGPTGSKAFYFGELAAREPFALLHGDHDEHDDEVIR